MNLLYTESILLTYLFTEYCYAVEVVFLTEHDILYWIMEAKGWTITFSICDLLDRYYLLTYLILLRSGNWFFRSDVVPEALLLCSRPTWIERVGLTL